MELVYLWVENYKNIQKQGFNFSPRFRCEYNKNKNELTINENKDYVSIFPDNINVTAIVGENGSGKSSLLRSSLTGAQIYIFYCIDKLYIYDSRISVKSQIFVKSLSTYEYILKYKIGFNPLVDKENILPFDISSIYFHTNILDMTRIGYGRDYIKLDNYFDISDFYQENYYKLDLKEDGFDTKHHLTNINFLNKISKLKNISEIIGFEINRDTVTFLLKGFTEEFHKLLPDYLVFSYFKFIPKDIDNEIKILFQNATYILFNYLRIYDEKYSGKIELENYIPLLNGCYENDIEIIKKIIIDLNYDKSEIYIEFIEQVNSLQLEKNIIKYYEKLFKLMNFSYENKLDYLYILFYVVSSGEDKKLTLFARLFDKLLEVKTDNILILLDEPTISYHPQWEKYFINELINFFIHFYENKKLHIIVTSHSPFILSDIPKQNVIFLEKDEKTGNCINASDKVDINPFGANIHTLLSHGFFMKDGLMGEFAKEKIQSIIKYHEYIEKKDILETDKSEYKTKKQKEFWQIQSIIGDDYLKQVIKNHLIEIEKIVLGNDEAKKEEVKRLKAQIELLEK